MLVLLLQEKSRKKNDEIFLMIELPLTVKLTFASTDPALFVARAIYG